MLPAGQQLGSSLSKGTHQTDPPRQPPCKPPWTLSQWRQKGPPQVLRRGTHAGGVHQTVRVGEVDSE